MLLKIGVVLLLLIIIYCLASALFFMFKARAKNAPSVNMVKALTWRIVLSFCLFLFLLFAYWMGWIKPHGIIIPANPQVSHNLSVNDSILV